MPVITKLPTMALAKPPLLPGGGVDSIKVDSDNAEKPRMTNSHRMKARTRIETKAAALHSPIIRRLTM